MQTSWGASFLSHTSQSHYLRCLFCIISTYAVQTHSVTLCKVFSTFTTLVKTSPKKIIHGSFIINIQEILGLSRSFKSIQNYFFPFYFSFKFEHYFIYLGVDMYTLIYLKEITDKDLCSSKQGPLFVYLKIGNQQETLLNIQ